jgi:hypothetical protein
MFWRFRSSRPSYEQIKFIKLVTSIWNQEFVHFILTFQNTSLESPCNVEFNLSTFHQLRFNTFRGQSNKVTPLLSCLDFRDIFTRHTIWYHRQVSIACVIDSFSLCVWLIHFHCVCDWFIFIVCVIDSFSLCVWLIHFHCVCVIDSFSLCVWLIHFHCVCVEFLNSTSKHVWNVPIECYLCSLLFHPPLFCSTHMCDWTSATDFWSNRWNLKVWNF